MKIRRILLVPLVAVITGPVSSLFAQGNTWSTGSPMPTGRFVPAAATIDNRLYVVGGLQNGGTAYSVVEVYDPQLNTWTPRSPMPTARGRLGRGVINNSLYAVGGVSGQPAAQTAVEAYDPTTNTWIARAPVNRERSD